MVRILGERTKQLKMGAKPLIKNYQDLSYEKIAEEELIEASRDYWEELRNMRNYKLEENYVSYEGYCYDSIHIISKKLYEDWFCTGNWNR